MNTYQLFHNNNIAIQSSIIREIKQLKIVVVPQKKEINPVFFEPLAMPKSLSALLQNLQISHGK